MDANGLSANIGRRNCREKLTGRRHIDTMAKRHTVSKRTAQHQNTDSPEHNRQQMQTKGYQKESVVKVFQRDQRLFVKGEENHQKHDSKR